MAFGFVDASGKSIQYNLDKGRSVMLVVGGAREALLSKPGEIKLTLKRRHGFVKQALRGGASLVPVFSFGETNLYTTMPLEEGSFFHKLQITFMNKFGFSTPIFSGRGLFNYSFGILPHRYVMYYLLNNVVFI